MHMSAKVTEWHKRPVCVRVRAAGAGKERKRPSPREAGWCEDMKLVAVTMRERHRYGGIKLVLLTPGRAAFVLVQGRHVIQAKGLGRSCGLIPLAGPARCAPLLLKAAMRISHHTH